MLFLLFFLFQFVENAKQVCEHLQAAGYWADFIDPSSGKAVSKLTIYFLAKTLSGFVIVFT